MKRICTVLVMFFLVLPLFADSQSVSPVYSYVSIGSGYNARFAFENDSRQSIPLTMQSGVLSNSDDGSFALGFGTRADFEFGIGSGSGFSMDILCGFEAMYRFSRNIALDVLAGLTVSILDTAGDADSIVTMGPGAAASVRLSPTGFSALSLDLGAAAYGHFAVDSDYAGAGITPFVAVTFDFGAIPYISIPHYVSHILVY